MRFPTILLAFCVVSLCLGGGCAPAPVDKVTVTSRLRIPKSIPPVPQHPLEIDLAGLPNFGFITPTVWRGGQPTLDGLQMLKIMGVKTIIDLRESDESADVPPTIAYIRIPTSVWRVDQLDVRSVNEAIARCPKPVYIHCREGRDRTGLAIAAYRLSQGMSADDACQELRNFHVNWWLERGIENRIYELKDSLGVIAASTRTPTEPVEARPGSADPTRHLNAEPISATTRPEP